MMEASTLSASIQQKLVAADFKMIAQNIALCDAIAEAVVEHIKTSAQVTTIVASGSSAGTYPGVVQ